MREHLIKTQHLQKDANYGSWSSVGEPDCQGRLMSTSLALCILEVYYRHFPLSWPKKKR
jgi:hypothetical protein